MPRYFIDFQEGNDTIKDEEGGELKDLNVAREQAVEIFSHLDYRNLCDGPQHTYATSVRDEQGRIVYKADLTFSGTYFK